MRIKKIIHHKNQPISYDEIEIEDIHGNKYFLCDIEIEELLQKRGDIEVDDDE